MLCPHCFVHFHIDWFSGNFSDGSTVFQDKLGFWKYKYNSCPNCNNFILHLQIGYWKGKIFNLRKEFRVYPFGSSRRPCPKEVPSIFAEDYTESCLVLPFSAKASAALSRGCLQNILREKAKVKPGNLHDEIQEVINKGNLPLIIKTNIDAIRNIGNFATHPIKSKITGQIIPVEPHEAEWNLDVLELLFDYYFVQPVKAKEQRDLLNIKLKEAGKKEIKEIEENE